MKKLTAKFLAVVMAIVTVFSASTVGITASAASVRTGSAKTGTYYTVYNVGSKKMLNVYASKNKSNTNVTVYAKDNTSGQSVKSYSHGTMNYNGVKFNKYYFVFKCATSCALNVYGSTSKNGSNVNIWTKSGNSTQDWILEYIPSKSGYVIRSANNPKYVLTAAGSSNSSNVCLKTYSSSNNYQIWQSGMFSADADPSTPAPSGKITTKDIEKVLNNYGYKTGKYWNYNANGSSTKSYVATDRKGRQYSYRYNGVECYGFANFVMHEVTGTTVNPNNGNKNGWEYIKASNVKELRVGDIVRIGKSNSNGHSGIVLKVDSNGKCTFAQCFGGSQNKISIGTSLASSSYGSHSTLSSMKNSGVLLYVYRYVG